MKYSSSSPGETKQLAAKLLKNLKQKNLIALFGDLGAGKTTFIQGLAESLGIEKRVISPTYVLMRSYSVSNNSTYNSMLHLDLYRISSAADLKSIDFEELIKNKNNLVVIEWAEKLDSPQLKDALKIKFKITNKTQREITIT